MKNSGLAFFIFFNLITFCKASHPLLSAKEKALFLSDSLFPALKGQFIFKSSQFSLSGLHLRLQQQFHTIPIFGTYLVLHLNTSDKLICFESNLLFSPKPFGKMNNTAHSSWCLSHDSMIMVSEKISLDATNRPFLSLIRGADTLFSYPLFHSFKDSTVKVKAYYPNPITSSHGFYGDKISDNNDANSEALKAELKIFEMKVCFDSGRFILKNEFLEFAELSLPTTVPTQAGSPMLFYTRDEPQFEEVNAFFHVVQQMEYLRRLGFGLLIPKLKIDAQALDGADQSLFKFNSTPYTIEFGTGGVDDAEDAEVIVHEYAHALSQTASPFTTVGANDERLAMEEGWADYFAVSHFKKYDPFNWEKIFDWDGHNPFWSGIKTNTHSMYPNDWKHQKDEDRALWSSPLLCICDELGKNLSDSLILELLFYQSAEARLPQMAEKLIKIDTLLFYGTHYQAIKSCFIKNGILKKDHRDLFKGDFTEKVNYKILNSSGFAVHEGPLGIKFNRKVDSKLCVYNLNGQRIFSEVNLRQDLIFLSPGILKAGLYFITLEPVENSLGFVNFYGSEKIIVK